MTALRLRHISQAAARVSRRLGNGLSLDFTARELPGQLTLRHMVPNEVHVAQGSALSCASGQLRLSDAGAVLSLLGGAPVVVQGDYQAWYWQFVNQQLSPPMAALLSPIEPLDDDTARIEPQLFCRLHVSLGAESVHAVLSTCVQTLARLLSSDQWKAHEHDVPDDWQVPHPVVLGQVHLTLAQLASLRPGDVLFPTVCHFDIDGSGQLLIAGHQWRVDAEAQGDRLVIRLGHEENPNDGQ